MSTLAKSAVLSLSLLAGVAFAAHAQSNGVASLPPATAAAPAAPVGPSVAYPGPNPGGNWSVSEKQTQAVQPSPQYVGPAPGGSWSTPEKQTQAVKPSENYPGVRPN